MFSRLRNHLGSAGLVVSIVALIAAVAGGAVAATQPGTRDHDRASAKAKSLTKKEVIALIKANAGSGPQGAAGANGKDGANGSNGAQGNQGPQGLPGLDGKGVVITKVDPGLEECEELGGAIVEVIGEPASAKEVCNGGKGEKGDTGDPWTAGGTLPPGATETGTWAFNTPGATGELFVPISFPVPLAGNGIKRGHAHLVPNNSGGAPPPCEGNVTEPTALAGELCVYYATLTKATFTAEEEIWDPTFSREGAGPTGALLLFNTSETPARGYGTFAVTGCSTTVGAPNQCP